MADADTSKRRRIVDRRLAVAAVVLWVVALALVAVYATGALPRRRLGGGTTTSEPTIACRFVHRCPPAHDRVDRPARHRAFHHRAAHHRAADDHDVDHAEGPRDRSRSRPAATCRATAQSGKYIDAHGGAAALAKVKPYLQTADLAFVNLEGPISDKGTKLAWKEYTFRSRTALASGLASAGVDVVSMANNHAVDCGSAALLDTIARLDKLGIAHAGAGKDISAARDARHPRHARGQGRRARLHRQVRQRLRGRDRPPRRGHHRRRQEGPRGHSGRQEEGRLRHRELPLGHRVHARKPPPTSARWPTSAIDAGADLILGHHPHVIQGLEVYHDKLIAYSLGDFVFDHHSRATGEAFVLRVTLRPTGPPVARIIPVYLSDANGIPAPVTGKRGRHHPRSPDQAERLVRGDAHPLGRPGLARDSGAYRLTRGAGVRLSTACHALSSAGRAPSSAGTRCSPPSCPGSSPPVAATAARRWSTGPPPRRRPGSSA